MSPSPGQCSYTTPGDTILIAQARADDLVLVTRDAKILGYGSEGATCAGIAR